MLVGIAFLLPLFDAAGAAGSPISDKRGEAGRIARRVEALGERLSVLDEEFNVARLRLQKVEAQVATAKAKEAETARRFDAAKGRARDRAVHAYMNGGGGLSRAARLVGTNGRDLVVRGEYLAAAAGSDQTAIDALVAAREDLAAEQAALGKRKDQAGRAKAAVDASRREAAKAMAEQRALLARAKGELASLVREEERRQDAAAQRRARADMAARSGRRRASRGHTEPPPGTDAPPPNPGAGAAVAYAKGQVGKPYQWGASGPDSYDCSGLTMASWQRGGVSLPHSSRAQYSATTRVAISDVQPGDLLFYGSPIHHVGIYVGGGQMIAAPQSGRNVQYQGIYRSDLAGVGRPG